MENDECRFRNCPVNHLSLPASVHHSCPFICQLPNQEDSDQAEDYDYLSDSNLEDDVEIAEPAANTLGLATVTITKPRV
jgi:hypothetical protein